MKSIAISANGISASIGNRSILQGIDLQLPAGRWTSIVGPNGAGKSTLLRCCMHLIRPDAGEVRLFGTPLGGLDAQAWELRAAMDHVPRGSRLLSFITEPQALR